MSLQVWLPLIKDLRNQGLYNITTSATGATYSSNTGKLGGCYSFDGDDYITIVSDDLKTLFSSATQPHSMSCWIYLNSDETDRVIIFGNFSANPFVNWELTADCKQRVCAGGTSDYTTRVDNTVILKQTWTHLAFTYNGSSTIFYINGQKTGTINGANTLTTMSSNTFWLGSDNRSGATRLKGRLNDFRIYDHCLSPMEIKELSKGLVLHYPLNRGGWGQENLLLNTGTPATWSKALNDSGYATNDCFKTQTPVPSLFSVDELITISFDWSTTATGGNFHIECGAVTPWVWGTVVSSKGTRNSASNYIDITSSNKSGHVEITFKVTSSQTGAADTLQWLRIRQDGTDTASKTFTISKAKLERGSIATPWCPNSSDALATTMGLNSTTEYDCSGFCNNGTRTGTFGWTSDTPKYGVSTHIGSTSSKIHISNFPTSGFGDTYSFAWWGKRNSNSPMFWGFSDGIRLNGMYTGTLWNTGDGSNNPIYKPNTTTTITAPSLNVWHHYVMTGDGSACKLYVDGELYGQAKTYKAISGTSIYINGWDSGTSYCSDNTDMSDFRIYVTALSPNDVKSLYQNSAYIDSSGNVYGAVHSEV